ncbi:MAG: phosphate ABC transporter substrate-binding protein [Desulfotomaculaceae bacterium]|nr:phosphate ABC transporter substrate-binding protein [Desulfotomaculaceae bacterium]
MLNKSKLVAVVLCLGALLAVAGCGENDAKATAENKLSGNITAVGSTALQPLVEQAANQFMGGNPDVRIVVQGGGSGTGLTQVVQGAANIGNSDIFADEKNGIDAAQLVDHQICVAGMAAVINPNLNIDNLTKQQLVDVFSGKVTNWKEVGGQDQKIVLVNRTKSSGTRATFKKYALGGVEEATGLEEDASGNVRKIVKETPGAIGYLALAYLNSDVKAIKLDGVEPNKENIAIGKYPVWAYEHCYTLGNPTGATDAFLNYLLTDDVQKTLVPQLGYIPVTEMQITRDAAGNVK